MTPFNGHPSADTDPAQRANGHHPLVEVCGDATRDTGAWPSLTFACQRPDPLVPAGECDAVARRAEIVKVPFGKQAAERLVVHFEVLGGPHDGVELRFIVPLPRRAGGVLKSLAPSSKLYRALVVANGGRPVNRPCRLSLDLLREKMFRIRVRQVVRDRYQQDLPESARYSVVDALLERLA